MLIDYHYPCSNPDSKPNFNHDQLTLSTFAQRASHLPVAHDPSRSLEVYRHYYKITTHKQSLIVHPMCIGPQNALTAARPTSTRTRRKRKTVFMVNTRRLCLPEPSHRTWLFYTAEPDGSTPAHDRSVPRPWAPLRPPHSYISCAGPPS